MKKNKWYIVLIIVLCLLILLTAGVVIFLLNGEEEEHGILIEQMENLQEEEDVPDTDMVYAAVEDDVKLLDKYKEYNSDVVGLIRINDTVLNHPIVQTKDDEEYYLYRDLDKNYNAHGVPFLSARCSMESKGGNLVVYGHNIYKHTKDVFADLMGYRDLEFYKEHPIVETVSKSGTRRWLIFAYFIVDNSDSNPFRYSDITEFDSRKDFDYLMDGIKMRNWLNVPIELTMEDTYLTLSSCSKELAGSGTNRMVVVAKQIGYHEPYEDIVAGALLSEAPLLPEKLR